MTVFLGYRDRWSAAPSLPAPGSFTVQAWVWPTMPGDRPQALLGIWSEATGRGFGLVLDAGGALALRLDEQTLGTGVALAARHWYLVAGSFDAARGFARVVQVPMVFFETPRGGAVFSTGSIGYAGALGIDRYDNAVVRLTTNVFRRFADPTPFEMPDPRRES